jgi:signal transduction histidine kinase
VLRGIQIEYANIVKSKDLEFELINNFSDTNIYGDYYSISQMFINLIDNAVRFTKKGGINVMIEKDAFDRLQVSVNDTGIGISQEFMNKMFEPFTQEDQSYSRKYEGNGLGLSLVKKYCELNGATIKAESEKGKGSKFIVTFIKEKINTN